MDPSTLSGWVLTAMVALAPPGRSTFVKAAQESKDQALVRYNEIAAVITKVSLDESETPILSRRFTAALLTSLTYHESAGWRRDVDLDLDRLRLSQSGWQDHGRSFCLGQHNLGLKILPGGGYTSASTTPEGWSGPELVADREKCIRATLHAARMSFNSTGGLPFMQKLAVYASGNATSEDGRNKSERRMRLAKRLFEKPWPPPAIVPASAPVPVPEIFLTPQ